MLSEILNEISKFPENGSGWYLKEVVGLEIHTVEYEPFRGSSYISIPVILKIKRGFWTLKQNR